MEKIYDVVAIGEYLIDFAPCGLGPTGAPRYEQCPGGAPANCLAACAGFGGRTAMIAAVGRDFFGGYLKSKAEEAGIDIRGIQTVKEGTTLAFVSLSPAGERDFAFVRSPGADTRISKDKIPPELLAGTKYLHFGSLSLTDQPSAQATRYAIETAREQGARISFDPNYRPPLWKSPELARERMLWGMAQAEVAKLSLEELRFLYGEGDMDKIAQGLLSSGLRELYITGGGEGAYFFSREEKGHVPAFPVQALDTTGCGDAFMGAILYKNTRSAPMSMREKVAFANAVGALCAQKPGGMSAMPDLGAVEELLKKGRGNSVKI